MDPICCSFEFYERKIKEHGGVKRRMLIHMGAPGDNTPSTKNLVAVLVEANDDEVFIVTATPEQGDTQTNHRFVFANNSYDEIASDPLTFIDEGIRNFLALVSTPHQGSA